MPLNIAPLFSGSSGNCTYVGTDNVGLLVDAGVPGKAVESALSQIGVSASNLCGILVTHEHIDHIRGVGILSRKYNLPVYATHGTWADMRDKLGKMELRNMITIEGDFFIGDICAHPVPISHDAAQPVGYVLSSKGRQVGILTDTGKVTQAMIDELNRSAVVLLECNHDIDMLKRGSYPEPLKKRILSDSGHLSNISAGSAAVELVKGGVRGILLAHLSKDNNDESIAYSTVCDSLTSCGISPGKDVMVTIAKRNEVTGFYTI